MKTLDKVKAKAIASYDLIPDSVLPKELKEKFLTANYMLRSEFVETLSKEDRKDWRDNWLRTISLCKEISNTFVVDSKWLTSSPTLFAYSLLFVAWADYYNLADTSKDVISEIMYWNLAANIKFNYIYKDHFKFGKDDLQMINYDHYSRFNDMSLIEIAEKLTKEESELEESL